MERKKLPNEVDTDELMSLLNNQSQREEPVFVEEDSFLSFLNRFNLKPGSNKISVNLLYFLYKKSEKNPMKAKDFKETCKFLFPVEHENKGLYIFLNENSLNLYKKYVLLRNKSERKSDRVIVFKTNFEAFLNHKQIKEGERWVLVSTLYKHYRDYCRKFKKSVIKKRSFEKLMSAYFKVRKQEQKVWVKIYLPIKRKSGKKTNEEVES